MGVMMDVSKPDSLIKCINRTEFSEMKKEKVIHSGMLPKLENALAVAEGGIQQVGICKYDVIEKVARGNFNDYTRIYG
jgi:acetylglutamate kinase